MIVAGFGFRGEATVEGLSDAYANAARDHDVSALATVDSKADTRNFRQLAATLGLPVVAIDRARLAAQGTTTQSVVAKATHGTGSVAEAAALAAAGQGARLLAPRSVSTDRTATCALAEGDGP